LALLSLLARLGSSKPVELAGSLDEIAAGFELESFGAAPTKFDEADLLPLTAHYLAALPYEAVKDDIAALGVPDGQAADFWEVVRENIGTRADMQAWWELMQNGAEPLVDEADAEFVAQAMTLLPEPPYTAQSWGDWTKAVKEATGRKGRGLFMPLRKALTGMDRGPDMGRLMPLLQKVGARKG
ncbi:MAG TPA: glutamate--tRNA ligase, partial [Aliiroseovarius sp.]|nr:glutamate--tRNA ligase [Aliiroseovarius sp.]